MQLAQTMHAHSTPVSPAPGPSSEKYGVRLLLEKKTFMLVDAEALRSIPCLERVDPARLHRQTRRQVLVDGQTMNVLSDVAGLTLFRHRKDARSWSMNTRHVNELTAPSLVYMEGVQSVSCCPIVMPCSSAARKTLLLTLCVQGSKHALVNDKDMTRLIAIHMRMRNPRGTAALALSSTSGTEIDNGQGALVATAGTELHEGQDALPLPVVATASAYALPEAQDLAPLVLAAPSSSLVLPPGCFKVKCKNASMYGKKMRDVHIGGISMQSDKVIRFRSSDGKVAVGDVLVGVRMHSSVTNAQKAIYKMIEDSDGMLCDLDSYEVDKNLADEVGHFILILFFEHIIFNQKFQILFCTTMFTIFAGIVVLNKLLVQIQIGQPNRPHVFPRRAQVSEPPRRAPRQRRHGPGHGGCHGGKGPGGHGRASACPHLRRRDAGLVSASARRHLRHRIAGGPGCAASTRRSHSLSICPS